MARQPIQLTPVQIRHIEETAAVRGRQIERALSYLTASAVKLTALYFVIHFAVHSH